MDLNLRRSSDFILIEANNGNRGQDRQVSNWMMSEVKEFLNDAKIFYEYISSLEEDSSRLTEICEDFKSNKLSVLQSIQHNYINELNFIRDIGGDVSNYTRYLSKLRE